MAIRMLYKHQVFWVLGIIFIILGSKDYIYNFVGKGFKYDNISFFNRTLKSSKLDDFRDLKGSRLKDFRALKASNLAIGF